MSNRRLASIFFTVAIGALVGQTYSSSLSVCMLGAAFYVLDDTDQ